MVTLQCLSAPSRSCLNAAVPPYFPALSSNPPPPLPKLCWHPAERRACLFWGKSTDEAPDMLSCKPAAGETPVWSRLAFFFAVRLPRFAVARKRSPAVWRRLNGGISRRHEARGGKRGGGNVLLGFRTSFRGKKNKKNPTLKYLLWLKRREFRQRWSEQKTGWETCDGSVELWK